MGWLIGFIAQIGSTSAGQVFLTWLASKIWGFVSDEMKNQLAQGHWESHVKDVLAKYDAVINDAHEKAKDGLTEEEKNEIRNKKIALELELLNSQPPKP
jgi:hypothetical protein